METKLNSISINGIEYVKKSSVINTQKAENLDGMEYVIVRTYSAGVFAGYLAKRTGQEVILKKARRLWYWEGAASLSQLAVDGLSKPKNCKFPCEVSSIELLQTIEILNVTQKAKESIKGVEVLVK